MTTPETRPATLAEIATALRSAFPVDDAAARVTAEHLAEHLLRCGSILTRRGASPR